MSEEWSKCKNCGEQIERCTNGQESTGGCSGSVRCVGWWHIKNISHYCDLYDKHNLSVAEPLASPCDEGGPRPLFGNKIRETLKTLAAVGNPQPSEQKTAEQLGEKRVHQPAPSDLVVPPLSREETTQLVSGLEDLATGRVKPLSQIEAELSNEQPPAPPDPARETEDVKEPICELCGEPMPPGEEMFTYHGYSGPCPKEPLPHKATPLTTNKREIFGLFWTEQELKVIIELGEKQELSEKAVLLQGLKAYQLMCAGTHELREINPDPKLAPTSPKPSEAGAEPVEFSDKRCSLCGAKRLTNGVCSLEPGRDGKGGCPDPLHDYRQEKASQQSLEELAKQLRDVFREPVGSLALSWERVAEFVFAREDELRNAIAVCRNTRAIEAESQLTAARQEIAALRNHIAKILMLEKEGEEEWFVPAEPEPQGPFHFLQAVGNYVALRDNWEREDEKELARLTRELSEARERLDSVPKPKDFKEPTVYGLAVKTSKLGSAYLDWYIKNCCEEPSDMPLPEPPKEGK